MVLTNCDEESEPGPRSVAVYHTTLSPENPDVTLLIASLRPIASLRVRLTQTDGPQRVTWADGSVLNCSPHALASRFTDAERFL